MQHLLFLPLCLLMIPPGSVRADDAERFELLDGDRVVFIGNTFIERDQVYGYLETMLTARWPDRNITFRNLGWSGDTVWGEARARFGTAADGFQHLQDHVTAIKPTVILVGYGANESFAGTRGLPEFQCGLTRLLDMLSVHTNRIVLLSPLAVEESEPALPEPAARNSEIEAYSNVIAEIAAKRQYAFVNLFGELGRWGGNDKRTDNGIHLHETGYWYAALAMEAELKLERPQWIVSLAADGQATRSDGAKVTVFDRTEARIRFHVTNATLPVPRPNRISPLEQRGGLGIYPLRVLGLKGLNHSALYDLHIDGSLVAGTHGKGWAEGVPLTSDPDDERVEVLRRTIIEKNRLYFHRWRPQNETYLFGFRKHEQGQNAAEVPKFDPLVEELETKIAKLRMPVRHTYEIIKEGE